jgi:hypothetical protein
VTADASPSPRPDRRCAWARRQCAASCQLCGVVRLLKTVEVPLRNGRRTESEVLRQTHDAPIAAGVPRGFAGPDPLPAAKAG